jgi:hypothetical protein
MSAGAGWTSCGVGSKMLPRMELSPITVEISSVYFIIRLTKWLGSVSRQAADPHKSPSVETSSIKSVLDHLTDGSVSRQAADSHYIPYVEMFFVGLACLGALGGVVLNILDARNDHILNRVHWKRA